MNEEEFRIRLTKQHNVDIFDLPIKQITINQILDEIGYSKYKSIREFVNLDLNMFEAKMVKDIENYMYEVKEALMSEYSDVGYDIDFTLFDLCLYVPFINDMFVDFLHMFTYCESVQVQHIAPFDTMLIVYSIDDTPHKLSLTRKQFEKFIDLFSILNYAVPIDNERSHDSESVKEFDRKAEEIKSKYGIKPKQDITIESIISSLIDSDNTSYTHENIGFKTMYQIMSSFYRMCKIKDNDFMNLVRVNCSKISESDIKKASWFYNLY